MEFVGQPESEKKQTTVRTGFLSQSGATAFSLNSRPPGVGLELSVDGTGIKTENTKITLRTAAAQFLTRVYSTDARRDRF